MKVKKKYAKIVKEYKAENYDAAWKLFNKLKSNDMDSYYIEAAISHKLENWVKEYYALKKLLPMLPVSTPEDKNMYEIGVLNFSYCCSPLRLLEESFKSLLYLIDTTKDESRFYTSINNICFEMLTKEDCTAADFHAIYEKYRSSFTFEPFPRRFYEHDKIRVGFLSGDFYHHVVMGFAFPLLTDLDRKSFEVYCYSNCKKNKDDLNETLRSRVDGWQDIYDMTDEQAAELIRDDEIDILFDLSGFTSDNRVNVMAYRPASVQISGIGFTASTGLKTVDYFLTDVHCVGNSAPYFTEKLLVLPHSHICYLEPPPDNKRFKLTATPPCFMNGYVTFGSFNQYRKISDSMLIAWKKIMDAVPNSRLLLKHRLYGIEGGKEFVGERFKRFGFDLKRVELRGFSKNHPFDYKDMDIALDTFPYNGTTTTCEAVYMGVPVISLYGDRHSTRCGLSILNNVGLYELAVDSYEDYVKRAVALASDWELLGILRKNLRIMMKKSPLMDSTNYVHEMEQAFIEILNEARQSQ